MDNLPSDIRLSFLTLLRLIPLNNKASVWQKTWSIPRCFQTQHTYSIQLLSCFVLWRSTRPSRTNIQKRCPLHYTELEWKSRKSRDNWSNRQIWPWSTKRRRLTEFCQDNALVIANNTKEYTWTSSDAKYQNQTDYVYSQTWRSSIRSAKTRPGADCGSDHELLMQNSKLNWRK